MVRRLSSAFVSSLIIDYRFRLGRIHWKIMVPREQPNSIVTIQYEDAPIFIGTLQSKIKHHTKMNLIFLSSYNACCDFLQNNQLLSIIRAHEAQDAG